MEDFSQSTVLDKDVDLIEEFKKALNDVESAVQASEPDEIQEKIDFLKFLLKDLEAVLSGEHEHLRRKRIIIKT